MIQQTRQVRLITQFQHWKVTRISRTYFAIPTSSIAFKSFERRKSEQQKCCTNNSRHYTRSAIRNNNDNNDRNKTFQPLSASEAGKEAFHRRTEYDDILSTTNQQNNNSNLETLLSHAGLLNSSSLSQQPPQQQQQLCNQPLSPPLHLASTYTRPPSGDYFDKDAGGEGWIYTRMGNPTRSLLEHALSQLEITPLSSPTTYYQNEQKNVMMTDQEPITCAFSSGMAAVSAIIIAMGQNHHPLHVILPDDIYHGVPTQLKSIFQQYNVTYSSVDMTNVHNLELEVQSCEQEQEQTKNILIWIETPSNPLCKVTDIQAITEWVQSYRKRQTTNSSNPLISTIVDSTWAPPYLTQPLLLGADAVLHSATKYLGGHSDVLLGTITTSPFTPVGKTLGESIRNIQIRLGATASPFDCWLTLRGLKTLHLRLEKQCQNAYELANHLSSSSHVDKVHYPGLESHPQYNITKKQMRKGCFGGMLSFEVRDEAMAMAVAGAVRIIRRATSLGGTETLIEHRASIEPADGKKSPAGLLRLSVGLENVDDLKRDLDIALGIAADVVSK